ncbi:MAG TPA: metalloregulator ArsR/SmtB family transcription factor [Pseudomonadales bacterium]|nr:metalloregulator ArsR/SmtB family transcription factor [Pseudomonadales bacterium]
MAGLRLDRFDGQPVFTALPADRVGLYISHVEYIKQATMTTAGTRTTSAITATTTRELATHADSASALLKCIANPNRLMILCTLAAGELSVSALNDRIPLSQSALSQHLAMLRNEGLVGTRREAQTIYYHAQAGPALEVIRVLHRHFCPYTT